MIKLSKKADSVGKKKPARKGGTLLIRNFLFYVAISFMLIGCDDLFRNPLIIDVVELDTINANQWYEFEINAEALHSIQEVEIVFKGSDPVSLVSKLVGHDKNFEGGRVIYTSTAFPEHEVIFEVIGFTDNGEEYNFEPSGEGNGVLLHYDDETPLMGKTIKIIRLKANLDHEDIKVTWISRTGK